MEFTWPSMLWLLVLIPLLISFYLRLDARRQRASAQFSALGTATAATATPRRHMPPALALIALIALIVALSRPEMVVSIPRAEGIVILAFDVSGSMAADDLEPTRMDAAKAAAREFVENQPDTIEIGVVSFSEGGITVQIPTNDDAAVLAAIERLSPQTGTSLGNGILASLNTLEIHKAGNSEPRDLSNYTPMPSATPLPVPPASDKSAVLVLLTDGENTSEPDPLAAAQEAANRGLRIYTIGIGTAAGTNLELDGFTVHTALDELTLQLIAQITEGEYYNAQDEDDLREIYSTIQPEFVIEPETMEITAILAGLSVLLLLTSSLVSFVWFNRLL